MPISLYIDWPALLLLIAANSTPFVAGRVLRGRFAAAPLDGGSKLRDGRPVFGPHKTWRGIVVGTVCCSVIGAWLSLGFAMGAAFGLLSLAGDLGSSFVKRRLGRDSGRWTPLLDQLPEALLPLVVLQRGLNIDAAAILGTAAAFTLIDLVASRVFGSWTAASQTPKDITSENSR